MIDTNPIRDKLDKEYQQDVKHGLVDEYEVHITITGRSAYDICAVGEKDLRYLFDEGDYIASSKDIKSIKIINKTQQKQDQILAPEKKVFGKGAFDGKL